MKNKIAWRQKALIVLQKSVRGYIVRKQHGPRIATLRNIRNLDTNLIQIEQSAQQLKKDKEAVANEINNLKTQFVAATDRIKVAAFSVKTYFFYYLINSNFRETKKLIKPLQKTCTNPSSKKSTYKWQPYRRK